MKASNCSALVLALVFAGFCSSAWAEKLDVKGDFAAVGQDGFPVGWSYHGWEGFMPQAKVDRVTADGKSVLRFRDVKGDYGAGVLMQKRFPGCRGDIVRISWSMRGKGKGVARFQCHNREGVTNGGGSESSAELTADWQQCELVRSITDGSEGENASFQVGLGCVKGSEAEFADVTCEIQRRFFDDFESKQVRAGDPEIISDDTAPGLLDKTKMGIYRTAKKLTIPFGTSTCTLPELKEINPFLECGFRLYALGHAAGKVVPLTLNAQSETCGLTLAVAPDKSSEELVCTIAEKNGSTLGTLKVPVSSLPADFLLRFSRSGEWNLTVRSLSDSSVHATKGRSSRLVGQTSQFAVALELNRAEMTVDNLLFGRMTLEQERALAPFKIDVLPTFDPVKAGWPLAFSDEFDGDQIDRKKWYWGGYDHDWNGFAFVTNGLLHLRADWADDTHEKLTTTSLYSEFDQTYGYFESRLRFTQKNGWWAAFWLYGDSNCNPFVDGFEIDIFEDYYTRSKDPKGTHKGILDHNNHIINGGALKSWNFNSTLPGSLDDFYVLGCKWTPFEISYYLNGKLIASKSSHGGFNSVTFDAFRHATGITPLHAIVSGQLMNPKEAKTGDVFPEEYLVDYVRVYSYPFKPKDLPSVSFQTDTDKVMVAAGDKMKVGVKATPAKATGAPIRTVYLFDGGDLIDYKTAEPFEFDVTFTEEFFGKTSFPKPGRSGEIRKFDSYPHVFCVFAQDADGRVAHSETFTKIVSRAGESRPYKGVAQKVPGKIRIGCFDEGGQGVAYHDTTPGNQIDKKWRADEDVDTCPDAVGAVVCGEWLTYSVDVEKAGTYSVRIDYGTPLHLARGMLLVDGMFAGRFVSPGHHEDIKSWAIDGTATIGNVRLTQGRHRVTFVCGGGFNVGNMTFEEVEK